MPDKISVLIVDDHDFFRKTLKKYLRNTETISIVGEAKNGIEAVTIAKKLSPCLVLMDITMPGMNGIEACQAIKESNPETKVVLFSMYGLEQSTNGGKTCAEKFVAKDRLFNELPSIIEEFGRETAAQF